MKVCQTYFPVCKKFKNIMFSVTSKMYTDTEVFSGDLSKQPVWSELKEAIN